MNVYTYILYEFSYLNKSTVVIHTLNALFTLPN